MVESGIPQGSVISPILFNIMINYIFEKLENNSDVLLYADDAVIWKRGRNFSYIVKQIQKEVEVLEQWGVDWGFKFSIQKSKVMYFTRKKVPRNLKIMLYNQKLERGEKFKYLGVWFDGKLSWKVHIEYIETKCKKVMNLMRMVTGHYWGADKLSLMNIYKALIRSNLDYGCIIYSSASKTSLKKLDSIQFKALRIALGAIKTTPTSALLVEAEETPLSLRFIKLSITYWVRLQGSPNNPAVSVLKDCWEYYKKSSGFGWNIEKTAEQYGMKQFEFSPALVLSGVPPWILPSPKIDTELLNKKKEHPNDLFFAAYCENYLNSSYYGFLKIFTDGSKEPSSGHCSIGIYIPEFKRKYKFRITNYLSIYSVEMVGIITALRWVEEVQPLKSIICTDSMSVLQSFEGTSSRDDLILEIKYLLANIRNLGIIVQFCWVPAHIGIKGNEMADKIAKKALEKEHIDIKVPLGKGEAKSIIKNETMQKWQDEWESDPKARQYHKVQSQVGGKRVSALGFDRREEVVYTRLRLGHTGLNSTLKMIGKGNGLCTECNVKEDVDHVLFNCKKNNEFRIKWQEVEAENDRLINDILEEQGMQQDRIKAFVMFLNESGLMKRI